MRDTRLELVRVLNSGDFKSPASADSANPAYFYYCFNNNISNLEEIQTLRKHVSDMEGNLEIDILTPNLRSHMRTVFDPDFFFGNNYTQNYIPRNVLKITIVLT